jgi:dTDP-4-dehydrorhamnose 3,5-epimerase
VYVTRGEVFDVALDIRRGSPTFAKYLATHLSAENGRQILIPAGFAHGFCVLSETADVLYKCTDYYAPMDEYGVLWSDSTIDIDWPLQNPILSEKDQKNPKLGDIPEDHLPLYSSEDDCSA